MVDSVTSLTREHDDENEISDGNTVESCVIVEGFWDLDKMCVGALVRVEAERIVSEILESCVDEKGRGFVKFKTGNSTYTLRKY